MSNQRFRVFVPAPNSLHTILPGSAIVTSDDPDISDDVAGDLSGVDPAPARMVVDIEGDRYQSFADRPFADLVLTAADRHTTRYPTVARRAVRPDDVIEVASFDQASGQVVVFEPDQLEAWHPGSTQPSQLQATGARYDAQRELQLLEARFGPQARHMVPKSYLRLAGRL